jgi:prepilin-type N-terminal cleavage/methylation domain-containing protein
MKRPGIVSVFEERAFTLLEVLAVLLVLGFLVVASLHKFSELTEKNIKMAVFAGVSEMNCRETMTWAKATLNRGGWDGDTPLFETLDKNLGNDFAWTNGAPAQNGGELIFRSRYPCRLKREMSSKERPGRWVVDEQK